MDGGGVRGCAGAVLGLFALNRQRRFPRSRWKSRNQATIARPLVRGCWCCVGGRAIWFNTAFLVFQPSLISGNSMNPLLYPGDIIIARQVAPEKIQVGDVIAITATGSTSPTA